MAENGAEFDGSELEQPQEQVTEPSGQVSEQGKTVEQPPQQATVEPPQQQTQTIGMPEKFRDYTTEQMFQEYNNINSVLARYKQAYGDLKQQYIGITSAIPQIQNRQPAVQTSLPGQEARQGQEDLASKYWEDPIPVLEQVVGKVARNVLQENERQQYQRQQQTFEQRARWISSVDDDELANLKLDESVNFTPEHEALMEAIAKRDPEIATKLNSPNLTEQDIRSLIRNTYGKADKILKGQMTDPEKIRVLNQAQKLAAANGAPTAKAGSTAGADAPSPLDHWDRIDSTGRLKDEYGFMVDLVNKSQS